MKTILLIILLPIIICSNAFAQNYNIVDSLRALEVQMKEDTNKVNLYTDLEVAYTGVDDSTRISYSLKALSLAKELGFTKAYGRLYLNIGHSYRDSYQYSKSIKSYSNALNIHESNNNKYGVAIVKKCLATIYKRLGDYDTSLILSYDAYMTFLKNNDLKMSGDVLGDIGNIYRRIGDNAKALEYYDSAINIFSKIDGYDSVNIARNLGNKANVFLNLKQYNAALNLLKRAININKRNGYSKGIAIRLNGIANIYMTTNKNDSAIYYCNEYLAIAKDINRKESIAGAYHILGEVYIAIGLLKHNEKYLGRENVPSTKKECLLLAVNYYDSSIALNTKIGNKSGLVGSYLNLMHAYNGLGKYKNALEAYDMHVKYKDSTVSEKLIQKSLMIQSKHEIAIERIKADLKKQQEITRRQQRYFFIVIIVLIVLSVLAYFKPKTSRKKM